MRIATRHIVGPVMMALLAGCAPRAQFDAARAPDWVAGSSERYPADRYFIGQGQAMQLDPAVAAARQDLAAALSDSVPSDAPLPEQLTRQAEVVDLWRDPRTQHHHVLVALERSSSLTALRQQLDGVVQQASQQQKAATAGLDPLRQISATRHSLALQQQVIELRRSLAALGEPAPRDEGSWSVTELQTHLKSLLDTLDIQPQVTDGSAIEPALRKGLDAAGMLSHGPQADYVLRSTLQRSAIAWKQGWFVRQGTLRVELVDPQGEVRGAAQWPLRARANGRAQVDRELLGQVEQTLKEELRDAVLGFAE